LFTWVHRAELGKILLDDSGLINKLAHCHETEGEQSGAKRSGHLVQDLLDSGARILVAAQLDIELLPLCEEAIHRVFGGHFEFSHGNESTAVFVGIKEGLVE